MALRVDVDRREDGAAVKAFANRHPGYTFLIAFVIADAVVSIVRTVLQ